jgi:hypothetical protein
MGLYYQTEYRLGRRGGRICRTYTGLRAVLAIAIDLLLILTFDFAFGLLFLVLRTLGKVVLVLLTAVFYLLSVPFRIARWVAHKLEQGPSANQADPAAARPLKPAWAGYDEI